MWFGHPGEETGKGFFSRDRNGDLVTSAPRLWLPAQGRSVGKENGGVTTYNTKPAGRLGPRPFGGSATNATATSMDVTMAGQKVKCVEVLLYSMVQLKLGAMRWTAVGVCVHWANRVRGR